MGGGVSKTKHDEEIAHQQMLQKQLRQQKDSEIAELQRQLDDSNRDLQQRDQEILDERGQHQELQRSTSTLKEQYETQIADNADQLSTAAATHAELETSLAQLQQQFEKETATFEKDKASLNKMIEVAQKAFEALPKYAQQIEDNADLSKTPRSEEVSEDVHKVITQKDCDILPEGIQNAIGDFQDNMRNMKAMQEAVAQSQDKVTEYWKKVQAHEALLLEQKRHILSIENKNEELKMKKAEQKMKKFAGANEKVGAKSPAKKKRPSQEVPAGDFVGL